MEKTFIEIVRLLCLQIIVLGFQQYLTDYFSYQIGYYYPKYEDSEGMRIIIVFAVTVFMVCAMLFVAWMTWGVGYGIEV